MILEKLVSKYIASAEHVFCEMEIAETRTNIDVLGVKKVLELSLYTHLTLPTICSV